MKKLAIKVLIVVAGIILVPSIYLIFRVSVYKKCGDESYDKAQLLMGNKIEMMSVYKNKGDDYDIYKKVDSLGLVDKDDLEYYRNICLSRYGFGEIFKLKYEK